MAVLTRLVIIASVLVLTLLLLQVVEADQLQSTSRLQCSPTDTIDCGAACEARWELSRRPNLCKRACGICCVRCQCVPNSTSGNDESCPCYVTMTTHDNKLKCPYKLKG